MQQTLCVVRCEPCHNAQKHEFQSCCDQTLEWFDDSSSSVSSVMWEQLAPAIGGDNLQNGLQEAVC